MTPGSELDAAVLRAMSWTYHPRIGGEGAYWRERFDSPNGCQSRFMDMPDECDYFSTDPNGHEALRLCGPWLDEHASSWSISHIRFSNRVLADAVVNGFNPRVHDSATRAEAICRLVIAIHERTTTNPPRAT